jgi:UDP:flavonoid glycosyltransferase YjiC (YdhE family)
MRLLFTASPAVGHLFPLLPVARAAAARGHDVAVGCGSSLERFVTRAGLRHVVIGPASLDDVRARIPGIAAATGRERPALMYREGFARLVASAMADGVLEVGASWRPELVVHEDMEMGSWMACERLGIRHVTIQAAAWRPWQRSRIEQPLNLIRRRLRLPADPNLVGLDGALWFTTRPASMRDPAIALPDNVHELRPDPDDRVGGEGEPGGPWPSPSTGRRRVVVTLGTVNSHRVDLLRPIIAGAAALPVEVIVGVGADPATVGPVPPNVHLAAYVPLSSVIPDSAATIHHGGSGTTLASLAAGRPMVVVPIAADQADNAEAVTRTGSGLVLDAETLDARTVAAALARLLSEPAFAAQAGAVRDEIAAMPVAEAAMDRIEALG